MIRLFLLLTLLINTYSQANKGENYTVGEINEKINSTNLNLDLFNIVKIAISESSNLSNYTLKQQQDYEDEELNTDNSYESHDK